MSCENLNNSAENVTSNKKRKKIFNIIFYSIFNPVVALLIVLAVIGIPFLNAYNSTFGAPSVYDNVFVAELGNKYERLKNIDEKKTVVIGGSSVAFGLDSELLSMYTETEVVNFGLYATLGSKVMLDLSENGLNEGDTVIFAPELDAQTLSLFLGTKSIWQAIDVNKSIFDGISKNDRKELLNAFPEYRKEKKEYLEKDKKPDPSGIYNSKNFNEYGDINYPRPFNTMGLGYDPNTVFSFDTEIVSDEFLDYFNAYCQRMEEKNVTVLFSYCPINELSVSRDIGPSAIYDFDNYMRRNLRCPVISSIEDYIMDWGYFFDTNLHLNDAGVRARTVNLIKDLNAYLKNDNKITVDIPAPPGKESGNELFEGDNTFMDYFTFENDIMPNGDIAGVTITGVTELAKNNTHEEITIPCSNGERMVIRINRNVLCQIPNLKVVHIGKNIKSMDDGTFAGCESLVDIYFDFHPDECIVTTPDESNTDGLMAGVEVGKTFINVKEEFREDFRNHYTWSHYFKFFR